MAQMEVVARHHPRLAAGNSPLCRLSVDVESLPDDPNISRIDLKDSISQRNADANTYVKDEEKAEEGKTPEEQDVDTTIPNSDGAHSTLSENSCEVPTVKSEKPSERDLKQMDFLLKGLPALGENFELHHKIGEGTFSSVFLATLRKKHANSTYANQQFAIKHLVPTTHPSRAERELKCLQDIGGKDNVVGVHLCLRHKDFIAFVMPYLPHRRFSEYVLDMGINETRVYMRNLLLALCRVHSFNIIHRDVKPSNFLYNRETQEFLLVDFGLSQPVEETAGPKPPKLSPECVPTTRKRKRCDEPEFNSSAGKPDSLSRTPKYSFQVGVTENVAKRRALQPCNNNSLNIIKTPEKGARCQVDNKLAPSMSTARARNLQNITNIGSNNTQKSSINPNALISPTKEAVETTSVKKTPRKIRTGVENLMKSPAKFVDKASVSADTWKGKPDENTNRAKFAAGFSKIKADMEARRSGQREPPQRKILFDDFPDPKPCASKIMTESRSAAILRRSLQGGNNKTTEPTRLAAAIVASVKSPTGPPTLEKMTDSAPGLRGRQFRTLVPGAMKDSLPGSSIVRVQNSQVKSQQKSPVTPSETRRQLMNAREREEQKVVFAKPHAPLPAAASCHCACFGKAQVCTTCLTRKPQGAPRAGTPGFRPPEVLLRCPIQTTAVDMWAAGIILLCILSGCYPFFRSPDDLTALAEIMSVFGANKLKEVAKLLGRSVVCSQPSKALDLKKLCVRVRQRGKNRPYQEEADMCSNCGQMHHPDTGCLCPSSDVNPLNVKADDVSDDHEEGVFPDTAYHLLARLLDLNPDTRITAAEALKHPFVKAIS